MIGPIWFNNIMLIIFIENNIIDTVGTDIIILYYHRCSKVYRIYGARFAPSAVRVLNFVVESLYNTTRSVVSSCGRVCANQSAALNVIYYKNQLTETWFSVLTVSI